MKKMICKLPVIYNGKWYFKGDTIEANDEHVYQLLGRCDERVVEVPEEPKKEPEQQKRRRSK